MAKGKKRSKKNERSGTLRYVFLVFILVIASAALYFYFANKTPESGRFKSEKYMVRGVDLSHHNPIIDWSEAKTRNNISFVYLKVTGGIKHADRNYTYNYSSAQNNNVKVGSYHFYLFGVSGKQQAAHFIKNMKHASGDLIPAIDVEHSSDNLYSTDTAYVGLVIQELKALENTLYEYFGVHPLIYTNKECYKLYVDGNFSDNLIWMCDLQKEPEDVPNWIVWQFSHKGELDGIVGDIDLNYFRYSKDELTKIMLP